MPDSLEQQLLRRVAALERRMASVIRVGRVAAVQNSPYRVSATLAGGVTTPLLHVLVPRSGPSMVDYSPLEVGEGVLVLAPGGEDTMFVLPSLATGRIDLVAGDPDTRFMSGRLLIGSGVTDVGTPTVRVVHGDLVVSDGEVADGDGTLGDLRTKYNNHTNPPGGAIPASDRA